VGEHPPAIHLHPGRDRSLRRRHPWIFASSISTVDGEPGSGDTVEVYSHEGEWLARGAFSPTSQIRVRVWTWDQGEKINEAFFRKVINLSIERRQHLVDAQQTSAFREVYAESDGVPGVIIDRYSELRVIQFLTAGAEKWRDTILQVLIDREDCSAVYERSDIKVRELEGLASRAGPLWGESPLEPVQITENHFRFDVDVVHGHKTGFYIDQRENRRLFQNMVPEQASVLDCFAYTGAFSLIALASGAKQVLSIDSSNDALTLAERNIRLNRPSLDDWEPLVDDVFQALRKFRDRDRHFDVIVLDPPKFAATPSHLQRATRGYKDINLLAFKLLRPGGMLFTYSCSGGVTTELFQKIVADAALDARKQVSIIRTMGQSEDHPVALNFPEGRYLKGLVCRVEDSFA
jgi:23S rRNA (cytosine1962-C5)-methyltransferase